MSFIVGQAGGVATTGTKRIMELAPTDLHQRCPVILGSKNKVERIIAYHRETQQTPRVAPTGQVAAKCAEVVVARRLSSGTGADIRGRAASNPRPRQHRITDSISASRGKDSL